MKSPRSPYTAGALALLLAVAAEPARALFLGTCSAAATPVAFGTYSPLAGTGLVSTGSVTVTCSGVALVTVPVTVSLNAGLTGTLAARQLVSGGGVLLYNLYTDTAEMHVWGDGTGSSSTVALSVFILAIGTGSAAATVYGLVNAGQDVGPGSYNDTITVTVTY